jgi:hypothetical protein
MPAFLSRGVGQLKHVLLACITRSEACCIAIFLVSEEKSNDRVDPFSFTCPSFPTSQSSALVGVVLLQLNNDVPLALSGVRHVASQFFWSVNFVLPSKEKQKSMVESTSFALDMSSL